MFRVLSANLQCTLLNKHHSAIFCYKISVMNCSHDASYPDGNSDVLEMYIISTDTRTEWNKIQKTELTHTIPVRKFSRNLLCMTSIQSITDSSTNMVWRLLISLHIAVSENLQLRETSLIFNPVPFSPQKTIFQSRSLGCITRSPRSRGVTLFQPLWRLCR